jgi:cytochrome c
MNSFELNKIAAAVLLAGIIAMVTGMLSDELVKSKPLQESVYKVPGLEASAPAEAAPAGEPEKIEPIAPLLASAKVADGEAAAKKCAACHSFNKGGANKVGPNLWDIIGASHAHSDGFAYSAALTAMKANPWDYEEMNAFLINPRAYAPGTKMAFAGIKKAEERAALIAYLRSLSDAPKPLP